MILYLRMHLPANILKTQDLIKVRGWQVSPAELEQCLLLHPAVLDAAVIGVDRGDGRGELPRAYIVLESTMSTLTDEAVRDFMDVRLSRYKALDGGIVRIDNIPRSAAGKILKPLLRKRAAKEYAQTIALSKKSEEKELAALYKYRKCFIF